MINSAQGNCTGILKPAIVSCSQLTYRFSIVSEYSSTCSMLFLVFYRFKAEFFLTYDGADVIELVHRISASGPFRYMTISVHNEEYHMIHIGTYSIH